MDQDWYNEAVDVSVEEEEELNIKNDSIKVQEKAESLYFDIRDYLYESGEINLLFHLDIDDVIMLLYDKIYITTFEPDE